MEFTASCGGRLFGDTEQLILAANAIRVLPFLMRYVSIPFSHLLPSMSYAALSGVQESQSGSGEYRNLGDDLGS